MLCGRCHNVVPDSAVVCVACGAPVSGRVDAHAATAFAPSMQPAQPNPGVTPTMVSAQAPVDVTMPLQRSPAPPPQSPTMRSHQVPNTGPASATPATSPWTANAAPSPQRLVTPAPLPAPPYAQSAYYAPPPVPGAYAPMQSPMFLAPMPARTNASGLAIASLVCGLLGLVPFWVGFLLCLLAITFAVIVLVQSRPGDAGRGMAIAGLVLGLVFVLPAACGL